MKPGKTQKKKCTYMNKGRVRCREKRYRKTEGEKSGIPGSDVEIEREGEREDWREGMRDGVNNEWGQCNGFFW